MSVVWGDDANSIDYFNSKLEYFSLPVSVIKWLEKVNNNNRFERLNNFDYLMLDTFSL